ncbi:MAG TPA: nucleoside-diphosphate sugar epimerase/dehydratase, partial [Longimicrobiaceae bacterium]|nr:nucleoside-diphosphate sugar epimerase/dehydratase [Longimicrobiaceae bacterium]
MLSTYFVRYRRVLIVLFHLVLIPAGYWTAFALRFDFDPPAHAQDLFWKSVGFVVGLRMLCFAIFGLFQGWWRHVGMRDLTRLLQAVTLSSLVLLPVLFFFGILQEGMPRSVLLLDWVMAVLIFGGSRFSVRSFRESGKAFGRKHRRTALIVGAGEAAERLLRQIWRNPAEEIYPVGLVDDDPQKRTMRLHGTPVLGTIEDIPALVRKERVQLLVIAIPSATREQMRHVVEHCLAAEVQFKIVPSLQELMDGRARVNQLRSVEIEDLLGRDAVQLDLLSVERELKGKVVMVTGAAGSIGSELARQVAGFGCARLVLVERAESPLYFTHLDLALAYPEVDLAPVVADVTDKGRMERVFAEYRPHYVFHAAAYKHVPLMESNVLEAVRNNVLGTLHVAECAAASGARKFVLISTDKAVHPSSVMGATKRIAERIVLGWPSLRRAATDFRAVRFGNVLGSEGSVVPLFKRQLAAGKPLTVTHPEVTRYFMTIPEAVQLVLRAAALPEAAGRISMLEMGEPVKIVDLAENLLRLSGLEPYRDVPIVFTGLRPGEKMHEELVSAVEATV